MQEALRQGGRVADGYVSATALTTPPQGLLGVPEFPANGSTHRKQGAFRLRLCCAVISVSSVANTQQRGANGSTRVLRNQEVISTRFQPSRERYGPARRAGASSFSRPALSLSKGFSAEGSPHEA